MRRIAGLFMTMLLVVLLVGVNVVPVLAAKPGGTTIQEGVLKYPAGHYLAGQPLKVGFDIFGYNYQGHMFSGSYANAYLGGMGYPPYDGNDAAYLARNPNAKYTWVWPYRDVKLEMKWDDAWLSNMDRDGDGKLDRHFGFASYIGSGAWETNHMWGDDGGHWSYFCKIVAAPAGAATAGGLWYALDGKEIGWVIWGEFAVIQEVESGSGILYKSPVGPGFGKWG